MVSHLWSGMMYSMQAPFYPREASSKGLRPSQYSLTFSAFELTGLIITPMVSYIIKDISSKNAACLALFTSGTALSIYGFLHFINRGQVFLIYSCLLRILESIGFNTYCVSGFTIVTTLYSDSPAVKTSLLLTCIYIGMTIGPIVGGMLFSIGGFVMPFLVLAPFLLVACLMFYSILPSNLSTSSSESNSVSLFVIAKIPGIWVGLIGCMSFSFCQGILQSTLATHLDIFQMSPQVLSFMFVISPAVNFMSTPSFGYLIQWGIKPRYLIGLGVTCNIVSFALLGPLPISHHAQPELWMCITALFFNGIAAGSLFTSAFSDPQQVIKSKGFPCNEETNGIISSLVMSSALCGGFIGPMAGGALQETMGMSLGSMIIIMVNIGVAVVMFTIICVENHCNNKLLRRYPGEKDPLLLNAY